MALGKTITEGAGERESCICMSFFVLFGPILCDNDGPFSTYWVGARRQHGAKGRASSSGMIGRGTFEASMAIA